MVHKTITTDTTNMKDAPTPTKHHEAILLVTFGSTQQTAHCTFQALRDCYQATFPSADIYMAFTSQICIERWKAKSGETYRSPAEQLQFLANRGYTSITIQSLHLLPGYEFSLLSQKALPPFCKEHPEVSVRLGHPLLHSSQDIDQVGSILYRHFSRALSPNEAWILMGHGVGKRSFLHANDKYMQLQQYFAICSPYIRVATIEGEGLSFASLLESLPDWLPKGSAINLMPLMSIVGDHTLHDLVGDFQKDTPLEEQSWRVQLQEKGYRITTQENCHLIGLADLPEICALWIEHTLRAPLFSTHEA